MDKKYTKTTKAKAMKGSPGIQDPYQKADISQHGSGDSCKQTQGADSVSKPGAAEKLMGGKDLQVVISQEASNSGISPQRDSSSSKHMVGGNSTVIASEVGSFCHLKKTKLSGSAKRKLKKSWVSQGCTGGTQQPECTAIYVR
jgi:hypothetical protein